MCGATSTKELLRRGLIYDVKSAIEMTTIQKVTATAEEAMVEQPLKGLLDGTMIFGIVLVVAVILVTIIFRKGQTCYANNFTVILIVMAYIMWACTYMCQMFPLIVPEYAGEE